MPCLPPPPPPPAGFTLIGALNEDVFDVRVLRFFIVSFKRFYDEYLVGFFFTIC